MTGAPGSTARGAATRTRIIETGADLVLARGVGGTSLDDIRAGTGTSKSQLFHYFPGGKGELVAAISAFQAERVREAQRPFIDRLDSFEAWQQWRDAVVAHYAAQPQLGCPIGALARELIVREPARAAELAAPMERWRASLEAGVEQLRANGTLRADCDPAAIAIAIFASLQGGLLLMQTMRSLRPLELALDAALAGLRAEAARP
jgi:AcrR family transcriptional regulator